MSPFTGEAFFLSLAQISLAFTGFGGLIFTLAQSQNQKWRPDNSIVLKFMFGLPLVVMFLALLPFPLYYWLQNEQKLWQTLNWILAGALGVEATIIWHKAGEFIKARVMRKSFGFTIIVYSIPSFILGVTQAICFTRGGSLVWYCVGLIYLLVQSVIHFWYLLTSYKRPAA